MSLPAPLPSAGPSTSPHPPTPGQPQAAPWSPPSFPTSQPYAHSPHLPHPSQSAYPPPPNAPPHVRNQFYQAQDFFATYPGHQGPGSGAGAYGVAGQPGQAQAQGHYYAPGPYASPGQAQMGGPGPGTMQTQMQLQNGYGGGPDPAAGAYGAVNGGGNGAGPVPGGMNGPNGRASSGGSAFNSDYPSAPPSSAQTDYPRATSAAPFSPAESYASHGQPPDFRAYPPPFPPYYPSHPHSSHPQSQHLPPIHQQHQHPQHQAPPHQHQHQHPQHYANMYPPGHPYAYGDGFGYAAGPGPGVGPGAYAPMGYGWGMGYGGPGLGVGHRPGGMDSGPDGYGGEMSGYGAGGGGGGGSGARPRGGRGKGLNPAAQGFSFAPASSGAGAGAGGGFYPQGPAQPPFRPQPQGMPPATTVQGSYSQAPSGIEAGNGGLPNGHDEERAGQAAETGREGSLGLSGMAEGPVGTESTLRDRAKDGSVDADNTEIGPVSNGDPMRPESTDQPAPNDASSAATPVSTLDPSAPSNTKWTFTGPLVAGYTSPTTTSTTTPSGSSVPSFPSIAQTVASSSSTSPFGPALETSGSASAQPPRSSSTLTAAPTTSQSEGAKGQPGQAKQALQLVLSRPESEATDLGVSVAAALMAQIPQDVLAQMEDLTGGVEPTGASKRGGRRGRKQPRKQKRVFSTDTRGQRVYSTGEQRTFGSIGPAELEALAAAFASSGSVAAGMSTSNVEPVPVASTAVPSDPTPAPKPAALKPTSWAGLFKSSAAAGGSGGARTFGRAISMPAHILSPSTGRAGSNLPGVAGQGSGLSGAVSPTMSQLSLATGTGTGVAGEGEGEGDETPRSAPVGLEGPDGVTELAENTPGSSRLSQAGPKKAAPSNYAAAAAHGAAMTPQEELARLLTDGLRGVTVGAGVGGDSSKGKEREREMLVPRGLINTGNMCFANTILQVLVYCPPFAELFEELGKRLKADLARRTPLLEAMIIFLREFVPVAGPSARPNGMATPNGVASGTSTPRTKRDTRGEAFVPENVYDAMKENKRFDSMRRGFQEDAEEYLGFFLNTLHEELLYLVSRLNTNSALHSRSASVPRPNGTGSDENRIQRPVSPGADNDGDGWLEVGKKQRTNVVRVSETRESAVSRLFGGTLRSVLHTPGQKDSVTLEPYQPLQLDIQPPQVRDITDALRHLSEPEVVGGVWSQTRRENVDATKQVYIETFPPVLILHLKRFVYDPREQTVVKERKPVAYGQELLVPGECISPARRSVGEGEGGVAGQGRRRVKYRLFGVVYHHGNSASGGHYTLSVARGGAGRQDPPAPHAQAQAQSQSQAQAGWLHFDDELVTPVLGEQVTVGAEEAESGRAGQIGGREKTAYLLFYQRVRS